MQSGWESAAEQAGVAAEVMQVLSALAQVHDIYVCARGGSGEIGMGAAPDAYAALYVSRRGMTLALEPDVAKDLAGPLGLSLVAKNPTTHYVKCPTERYGEPAFTARVLEAAEVALNRSWRGPRWDRLGASSGAGRLQPTCPVHIYELSATGFCMGCDDQAPVL